MNGRRQCGFSYAEIMVAVVLLAVCAVPMADAISKGLLAADVGVAKARELRCMKNTMETILAQPHQTLWGAALKDRAASYVLPADAACADVVRKLTISLYEHEANKAPVFLPAGTALERARSAMLHVALSTNTGYGFTTLVSR